MSFRVKVLLGLLVVGIGPMALLAFFSYRGSRERLGESLGRLHAQNAEELARFAGRLVDDSTRGLALAATYIPFNDLSGEQLHEVLGIPYSQITSVSILAVFDQRGAMLAQPMVRREGQTRPELESRPVITAVDIQRFGAHLPDLAEVLKAGRVVGAPYDVDGYPRVAVALSLPTEPVQILTAEISLREVGERLEANVEGGPREAFLADRGGQVVYSVSPKELSEAERAHVAGLDQTRVSVLRAQDGEEWLSAAAPVPGLKWTIVVAERASSAFAAAEQLRSAALFWAGVALLLTILIGIVLARGLGKPIALLASGARDLAHGKYTTRVVLKSDDELGKLAGTFNQMASEIERQTDEIRWWNEKLQQRVDQRTAELRIAQDQISRTQRLTALGSLGAGVAHELNNPLTAIVGMLGLLERKLEDPKQKGMVQVALEQARRATKVISDFQEFAQGEMQAAGEVTSAISLVKSALSRFGEGLHSQAIVLLVRYGAKIPRVRVDDTQVEQALFNVLQNSVEAMPEGGQLTIAVDGIVGEAVKVAIKDDGPGIAPEHLSRVFDPFFTTKPSGDQVGMGLATAARLMEANGGSISVQSEVGHGAAFTVVLPAAPEEAHLR